jgi:hypothetical protein
LSCCAGRISAAGGINKYIEAIAHFLSTEGADFGLKILGAIAARMVGRWLFGLAGRAFGAALERGKRAGATLANSVDPLDAMTA